jgi:pimeloyl-ACP methyl ester carboxylesterase
VAIYNYQNAEINYEFSGDSGRPVIVFINGLTQRVQHWQYYSDYMTNIGYSVLLFDLMGQGSSGKPTLFIDFADNQKVLSGLLDHLKIEKAYVAGISFGGVVALRFAIEFPERTKGVIPMSTFSEMDAKLLFIGTNLYEGMVKVGFEYLVKWFTPFNFTAEWIEKNQDMLPTMIRASFLYNDLYAIQNMMESLFNFKNFTHELYKIKCPTVILNAEFDALTPRSNHEILRVKIKNSRLILMQHVCHAFTLEIPEITCRVIDDFVKQVEADKWQGDQSVWIATDNPHAKDLFIPCNGNHLRAIPI